MKNAWKFDEEESMRAAILNCNCFRCYVCQQLEITTHKPKRNVLKITNEAINDAVWVWTGWRRKMQYEWFGCECVEAM